MRACDWPEAHLQQLRDSYADTSNLELAERFRRSERSVYAQAKRLGLSKDATYLRTLPRGFRARAEIGDERICDGYRFRKVADDRWAAVHILVWEQHYGQVPPSHVVMFKDGDKANTDIDNLECIPRAEQLERYTVMKLPAQLREVVWLKGALTRKINAHDY